MKDDASLRTRTAKWFCGKIVARISRNPSSVYSRIPWWLQT